jgi:excisionase family DNA binding protein
MSRRPETTRDDARADFVESPHETEHAMNALDLLGPHLRAAIEQLVTDEVERRLAAIARPEPPSPYMTPAEAATYLRASRQRIYDLLSAGRLTRHRDGSRVLIARDEVETYLTNRDGKA